MAILSERETRAISGAAIGASIGALIGALFGVVWSAGWRLCRRTAWSRRPSGEIRTMKPSELFTIETAMAVGVALALGSCARFDPLGFGVLNPPPGLTFLEFRRATSEALLALQLHFDMSALCFCLMCSSPERPSDDELWSDAFARKARRDTADFLHRPADQRSCDFTADFVAALRRVLFGGDRLVASATAFA